MRPLASSIRASVRSLVQGREQPCPIVPEEDRYVAHVLDQPLSLDVYAKLKGLARAFGVTRTFRSVIDTFKVPAGETPAGFRIEFVIDADAVVRADLVRDISYDRNGQKRADPACSSAPTAPTPTRSRPSPACSPT